MERIVLNFDALKSAIMKTVATAALSVLTLGAACAQDAADAGDIDAAPATAPAAGEVLVPALMHTPLLATTAETGLAATAATYRHRSPGIAFLLSWLYPGIGQFYNGQTGKGVVMTVLATAGYGCMFAGIGSVDEYGDMDDDMAGVFAIGTIVGVCTSIWSMIDAPVSASKINRRNAALSWNVGGESQLKLRPAITYESPAKGLSNRRELAYGLALKYEF